MREKDLEKLELPKVKEILKSYARSEATKRLIDGLRPLADEEALEREKKKAEEFLQLEEGLTLGAFEDLTETLKRASLEGAVLTVEEVLSVLKVAELTGYARQQLSPRVRGKAELEKLTKKLHPLSALVNFIKASVDPRGFVRDEASDELLRVRRSIRKLEEEIRKRLESLINRPDADKFLSDRIITIRNGRYVVPVKTAHVKKIFGIVHGTSSSGYTTYVEPQFVVQLNNKLAELKVKEEEEVRRVLSKLTELIRDYLKELSESFSALVELDLLSAKRAFAEEFNAVFVKRGDGVELYGARHPLLVKKGGTVVPVDLLLKEKKGVILTGPNTGGKTVALKTLGLFVLMNQCALPLPVKEGSRLPVFKKVFVDVGDEQSIEQSLSTFSAHVKNMAEFLPKTDGETLVLLDELGAGTDPVEGSALAVGLLEYLKERGAWVFATTHHTPVKLYATTSDYYEPASVLFDKETLRPLYRIVYGVVGESMALYVARKLGLPEEVIKKATEFMGEQGSRYLEVTQRLAETVEGYERERERLEELKKALEEEKRKLERLRAELEEEKRKAWKGVYREAKEYLRKLKEQARELTKSPQNLEGFLKEKEQELKKLEPKREPPKEGQRVRFMGKEGVVLKVKNGKAFVALEQMKLWVDASELEPVKETEKKSSSAGGTLLGVRDTVNLMGRSVEEALLELERFLEEASAAGLEVVKVVHGIGRGKLRSAVREFLSKSERVKFFRDAYPKEGGSGVTVVYLKEGGA
ncbi:MAG: endonuclease MutS2 [Aquificae bacterium]|nr:endonuclease MutS2 [Aquificota bacterium]